MQAVPVGRKRAHQPTQLREIRQTKELLDWGKCSRLRASKLGEKVALGEANQAYLIHGGSIQNSP